MKSSLIIIIIASLSLLVGCATPKGDDVKYRNEWTEELAPIQLASDKAKAFDGDAIAAQRLGRHYLAAGKQDLGFRWLRISSIMGRSDAQRDFFVFRRNECYGDELDDLEGKLWLMEACKNNNKDALKTKLALMKYGSRESVELSSKFSGGNDLR